jgi:DNA helicase-2/ATP-dependent DNA helicase PcrA
LSAPRSTKSESERVGEDIDEIRRLYDSILSERYDHAEPRLADLDQLRVIASGYPSRAAFLAAVALEPPQSTQDLAAGSDTEEDALVISTVHSSKGKEWDAVFVIWAVDGWFPLSRSLGDDEEMEEERRLMYVAMTRARNHLAVTYPLNVYATRRGSDYSIDQLSRFIDRGVRDRMQRVVPHESATHPAAGVTAPVSTPQASAPIDLRALLRGRFSGPPAGSS